MKRVLACLVVIAMLVAGCTSSSHTTANSASNSGSTSIGNHTPAGSSAATTTCSGKTCAPTKGASCPTATAVGKAAGLRITAGQPLDAGPGNLQCTYSVAVDPTQTLIAGYTSGGHANYTTVLGRLQKAVPTGSLHPLSGLGDEAVSAAIAGTGSNKNTTVEVLARFGDRSVLITFSARTATVARAENIARLFSK